MYVNIFIIAFLINYFGYIEFYKTYFALRLFLVSMLYSTIITCFVWVIVISFEVAELRSPMEIKVDRLQDSITDLNKRIIILEKNNTN